MSEAGRMLALLAEKGLLLKQDPEALSVVTLLTGERLSTSWWAHPKAHEIFAVLTDLASHADVTVAKLHKGKDTFVHRRLWPALRSVARCREPWQTRGLSKEALELLETVESAGPREASGPAARELESRLLVRAEEVHTALGRHLRVLEPWTAWARRVGCGKAVPIEEAKAALEAAALGIGASKPGLPWAPRARSGRRT